MACLAQLQLNEDTWKTTLAQANWYLDQTNTGPDTVNNYLDHLDQEVYITLIVFTGNAKQEYQLHTARQN